MLQRRKTLQVKSCFIAALCLGLALFSTLEAQRPGGGDWPGGGRPWPGREGRKNKEKEAAKTRLLRVCNALSFSGKQLKKADALFKNLQKERQGIEKDQQTGVISVFYADRQRKKAGGNFEKAFITLLDETQQQKFDEMKKNKTIEREWW